MKKFIVLTRSRTGSNFLISLLNSHKEIKANGELVARKKQRSFEELIEEGLSSGDESVKASGFKIFYYHPIEAEGSAVWEKLVKMTELKVIHLKRRNILRTLVSHKLANLNNVWRQTADDRMPEAAIKRVRFNVEELERGFKNTKEWEAKGDLKFEGHNMLVVYYEDLISDPAGTCGGIFDFLGVRAWDPHSSLVRQNPERLNDLIVNFDELKGKFSGTRWAYLFN